MTEERMKTLRTGRKIGALSGGIVFVVFGIVPGFYFGSAATVILLSQLAGGPLEPGIMVRMLLVVGTMLGLFCVAAVSIVAGSVVGTALAYVADIIRLPAKEGGKEASVPVK
ncbi:hypothetical protein BMS3Abin07_01997 [bacterium BMS3Abin07]|nr:hypothetical protein BMS3Abin07_01997 [bacterium BMS3Abin07]GBE32442.1 hypothetical protein BMS3Bbin05_01357 [bacterium BMS3Bbin05]HDL20132.1 hypothetical protein [Nitrospirota bacterium]HDO23151.1 hypothetical protein [Nitrospirota bacterium]HDZ87768.1 hypothetical protein [Nitrospirota bacterium]